MKNKPMEFWMLKLRMYYLMQTNKLVRNLI